MSNYTTPHRDMLFAIEHLADLEGVSALPGHEEVNPELVRTILEEAGKIGEDVLAPLNMVGDHQGVRLEDGEVITPDGWKQAYELFIESGWNSLPFDPDRGGQGLPWLVATAVQEIWHSSNMAFSLCSLLTQAAIEAIRLHGSDDQKETYLSRLIHGSWAGTMNLTESHAGSDLALIKTSAIPEEDHYLIQGQKIFITYGDHDLTDNIIHLVLARLPDAPPGIKGISLFIVPKFLPDEDGNWTVRNDVETVSLERKLGIHASPTAVLGYGTGKYRQPAGAMGYLVGEPNQGMAYMFTMMNIARLAIGIEGNGVAERAYQLAVGFARERIQGVSTKSPSERVTIIHHPDVKRMLMLQKCRIEGLRSLGLVLGAAIDKSLRHPDRGQREFNCAMVDMLTPIVKGYTTEIGLENVSLALQVHGGMGFIEETGAAQHYRDQRITPIYEGTTGIQAMDLIGRKTIRDRGRQAAIVIDHIRRDLGAMEQPGHTSMHDKAASGLEVLEYVIQAILDMPDPDQPAAVCDPYLRLWGIICCGWQLAKAAGIARTLDDGSDPFFTNKTMTARFFFDYEFPKLDVYRSNILDSAATISAMDSEIFTTQV